MKDAVNTIYNEAFGITLNDSNLNKAVKAVIINFKDARGDIIVTNDNFGTRRKHMCFTEGRKAAGLDPLQIVFRGVEMERILHGRYIGKDDRIHSF